MKTKLLFTLVATLLIQFSATAADLIPKSSKIYIETMESGLDQFIAAEMIKQKVPVSIVVDEKSADYILTGTAVKKDGSNKWYHVLTGTAGTMDSVQASVSLINKSEKTLIWAGNAGDRSIMFGALKRGGERKAALRIVSKFKAAAF